MIAGTSVRDDKCFCFRKYEKRKLWEIMGTPSLFAFLHRDLNDNIPQMEWIEDARIEDDDERIKPHSVA